MPTHTLWDEDGRLWVSAGLRIPAAELTVRATRAGGPGGQHVNTSSTRVEVTWNLRESAALSDEERARLSARLASRVDARGVLRVVSAETRSQSQNRHLALARLAATVRNALVLPKARKATAPTRASRERRLDAKRKRGDTKRGRRWRGDD